MWTGIPVFKLTEAETERLVNMEDELHKRDRPKRGDRRGLEGDPARPRGHPNLKRPTGSFIFLGPSGVGKTDSPGRSQSSSSATRTR